MSTPSIPNPFHKPKGSSSVRGTDGTGSRLLLVIDTPERLQRLENALSHGNVAVTRASSAEEMAQICRRDHDLAIVDVEPADLAGVLKTLRESSGHENIPVLVDRSRMAHDATLAGVLPAYRAMPCSFDEMMKLAARRLASGASRRHSDSRGSRQIL